MQVSVRFLPFSQCVAVKTKNFLVHGKRFRNTFLVHGKPLVGVYFITIFCTFGIVRNCMTSIFFYLRKINDKHFWSTRVVIIVPISKKTEYLFENISLLGKFSTL